MRSNTIPVVLVVVGLALGVMNLFRWNLVGVAADAAVAFIGAVWLFLWRRR